MISLYAELQDVYISNTHVNDLLDSFDHPYLQDAVTLKVKKNRRKYLKDRDRFIKIEVLKRSRSTSHFMHRRSERKYSQDNIVNTLNSKSDSNAKRHSDTYSNSRRNSTNALLGDDKMHSQKLNVSAERSSARKDSQLDADQGSRVDSPLIDIIPPIDSINESSHSKYNSVGDSEKMEEIPVRPVSNSIKDLLKNRSQRLLNKKSFGGKKIISERVKRKSPKIDSQLQSPEVLNINDHQIHNNTNTIKKNSKKIKLNDKFKINLSKKYKEITKPNIIKLITEYELLNEEDLTNQNGSSSLVNTLPGNNIMENFITY
jgi:hypothetical protein